MRLWFKHKKKTPTKEELLKQSLEAKLAEYQADPAKATFDTTSTDGYIVENIAVDTDREKIKTAWDNLQISREAAMRKKDAS